MVGDFNFDVLSKPERDAYALRDRNFPQNVLDIHEEKVILNKGFEDVVHNFIEEDVPTMN